MCVYVAVWFVVVVVVRSKSTLWVCGCVGVSDNDIGEEGAKALGPHLAKLVNMSKLWLDGNVVEMCAYMAVVMVRGVVAVVVRNKNTCGVGMWVCVRQQHW